MILVLDPKLQVRKLWYHTELLDLCICVNELLSLRLSPLPSVRSPDDDPELVTILHIIIPKPSRFCPSPFLTRVRVKLFCSVAYWAPSYQAPLELDVERGMYGYKSHFVTSRRTGPARSLSEVT
jgi:hypothetical protein